MPESAACRGLRITQYRVFRPYAVLPRDYHRPDDAGDLIRGIRKWGCLDGQSTIGLASDVSHPMSGGITDALDVERWRDRRRIKQEIVRQTAAALAQQQWESEQLARRLERDRIASEEWAKEQRRQQQEKYLKEASPDLPAYEAIEIARVFGVLADEIVFAEQPYPRHIVRSHINTIGRTVGMEITLIKGQSRAGRDRAYADALKHMKYRLGMPGGRRIPAGG